MIDFKQENPLDVHNHRISSAHARKARKIGNGNESEGVRIAIEKFNFEEKQERRSNKEDRRKKK